jgi:peptide/nickel transport system substrate-binding protein
LREADGTPPDGDFSDNAVRVDDYEALKKIEQDGKLRIYEVGPGLDAGALWFRPASAASQLRRGEGGDDDRPWLGSEPFRLAISAAIDRREYCKQVFFGACDPMLLPVSPSNVAWYNPDVPLGRGDAELAREMLAEMGLRDRTGDGILEDAARRKVGFSLLIRSNVPSAARAGAFFQAALRAAVST